MKYGLELEPVVVKEIKTSSHKCGLLVHPDIYWMGFSPDGIIYDPNAIGWHSRNKMLICNEG